MSKRGLGKFIIGAGIGAGIALLFAPKKGEELRQDLLAKASELLDKLKEVDTEEVKNNIEAKVKEIQDGIKDLDKEKGTPVLEKTAKELKKKTASVLKEVLAKLEEEK